MFAHRIRKRAEDDAEFGQLVLVSCADRNAVEYRIHCHPGKALALMQRNAEFFIGAQQFGINISEALRVIFHGFRRREVDDVLVVDGWVFHR